MREITISASIENFEAVNAFVKESAERAGFDDEAINKILLATEEIYVNVVHYAYKGEKGPLIIKCETLENGDGISIQFVDNGIEFNPLESETPDTDASVEDRPIGGLGIFLVKTLMDGIEYRREKNRNVLLIKKNKI